MSLDLRGLCPLLQVFDMPRSLAFYRDLLGFAIVQQAPQGTDACDWAWLRHGTAELMLNTMYESDRRPATADAARTRAHDYTCLYIGAPDVDGVYRFLRTRGIEVPPPKVAPYGMKQLYLRDPDGYQLSFQWPAQ